MLLHSRAAELLSVQKDKLPGEIIPLGRGLQTHSFPLFSAVTFNTRLAAFHLENVLTRRLPRLM